MIANDWRNILIHYEKGDVNDTIKVLEKFLLNSCSNIAKCNALCMLSRSIQITQLKPESVIGKSEITMIKEEKDRTKLIGVTQDIIKLITERIRTLEIAFNADCLRKFNT